ncbi:MAG: hypothetical protein MK386_08075 [Candidatus Thioglobus autotrophicus]|nr:hypothetical protein [Candidatus Thioglobus autotrophicus]
MATTKIRSSSILDGQVAIADIVGGGAAAAGTFLKQDGTWAETGPTSGVFTEYAQTVSTNYTITASKNALTLGDITVNSGITVTVPSGTRWYIL